MNHLICNTVEHFTEKHKNSKTGQVYKLFNLKCLDHNVITCRCGIEWGKHYPNLAPVEANFKEHMKDMCIVCKDYIPRKFSFFRQFGNFCRECNKKIAKNLALKKIKKHKEKESKV